jgi:hypothetical protein
VYVFYFRCSAGSVAVDCMVLLSAGRCAMYIKEFSCVTSLVMARCLVRVYVGASLCV